MQASARLPSTTIPLRTHYYHHHGNNRIPPKLHAFSSQAPVDEGEVDPMTGDVISGTSMATFASNFVSTPSGHRWAYRCADVASKSSSPEQQQHKLPVVCIHGLGSSSYAYRNVIRLLGDAGHEAIALDWLGHGASDKPLPSQSIDYSIDTHMREFDHAMRAVLSNTKLALVVHGYILSHIAMLWASQNPDIVSKLIIMNTPLSLKSKLRPELAAYKAPLAFMRPKPDAQFDGGLFAAAGGPYAMASKDAQAYDAPYQRDHPAASVVIHKTMEQLDFPGLLTRVDEEFRGWRDPGLCIHGGADTFIELKNPLEWLESKRTCMKMAKVEAKIGHCPHEDYPEAVVPVILDFLTQD